MKKNIYREELEKAIANLYDTFAIYPLRSQIEACPCCVKEEDKNLIYTNSLNLLTGSQLNKFAFKSISTWGIVDDFKHFIPRLLELTAFGSQDFFWANIVIRKLEYANFNNWSEDEKIVIKEYSIALWNYILAEYPAVSLEPESFLYGFSTVFTDLTIFLQIWQNYPSNNALLHLAYFIIHEIDFNKVKVKIFCFSETQTKQFMNWLLQPAILDRFERAFFNSIDRPYSNKLAEAFDLLDCAVSSKIKSSNL